MLTQNTQCTQRNNSFGHDGIKNIARNTKTTDYLKAAMNMSRVHTI